MAELLVFSHDHGDDAHPMLYRPGDVVTVQKDGWTWGREELSNPIFRIIAIPGLPVVQAEHLLSHQLADIDHNLSPTTHQRRRGFAIDITALPAGWWADDSRAAPSLTLTALPPVRERPKIPLSWRL